MCNMPASNNHKRAYGVNNINNCVWNVFNSNKRTYNECPVKITLDENARLSILSLM